MIDQFTLDIEALQVQINHFAAMQEEINIELENLEEDHDNIMRQQLLNKGYMIQTNPIGFNDQLKQMFQGLGHNQMLL